MISFRGQKKVGLRPSGVQFKILMEHPRPFHMGVSPRNSTSLYRTPSPQRKKETTKQTSKQTNCRKRLRSSKYRF